MKFQSLSPSALALFRLHVERRGDVEVDDSTRELYRELARAGLMRAATSYARGEEATYRMTKEGFESRAQVLARAKESA